MQIMVGVHGNGLTVSVAKLRDSPTCADVGWTASTNYGCHPRTVQPSLRSLTQKVGFAGLRGDNTAIAPS